MPVCGTTVSPSEDTATPAHDLDPVAEAIANEYLLTLRVPPRKKWTPSTLAEDLGDTPRTWQRRCENGELCAVKQGREYIIVRPWLVRYFAARQNLSSLN